MAFSTDADLMAMQPGIFDYGFSSFEQYHPVAEAELARDIRILWIPRQRVVKAADFDHYQLDAAQWKRAACCRVLGWHVLPMLAVSTDATTFWLGMADDYQKMYREEINTIINVGVWYDAGAGLIEIASTSLAESQRIWR